MSEEVVPRRALAVDQVGAEVELLVDGALFHVCTDVHPSRLVKEIGGALEQGATLTLALRDRGTLVVNGRTVHSVAVLPAAHEDSPRPRRALAEDE
jgi:hypothetical protein